MAKKRKPTHACDLTKLTDVPRAKTKKKCPTCGEIYVVRDERLWRKVPDFVVQGGVVWSAKDIANGDD